VRQDGGALARDVQEAGRIAIGKWRCDVVHGLTPDGT
jgi:hypothetical protein